jgi:HK97 family phage major capsid protein
MNTDIRTALYDLGRSFESFKEANDQRLREIERRGAADPLTEMKVNRLNAEVSRATDAADAARKRVDLLETALSRAPSGQQGDLSEADVFARERKHDLSVESYRQYRQAFRGYIHKNNAGSGVDEIKALSVGSDPDGGYAVTPDMGGRISALVRETSPMRQVANVITIGTDALEGIHDLNEATSGWVGETETRSETTAPKIGEYRIPVHEQYAEPRATQKLLDDALFNVEEWLAGKIAERLARMENEAFVAGNGVRKPRGFLTYAAGAPSASAFSVIEQIPTGGTGAFAAADPGDALIMLVYGLKAAYRENAPRHARFSRRCGAWRRGCLRCSRRAPRRRGFRRPGDRYCPCRAPRPGWSGAQGFARWQGY